MLRVPYCILSHDWTYLVKNKPGTLHILTVSSTVHYCNQIDPLLWGIKMLFDPSFPSYDFIAHSILVRVFFGNFPLALCFLIRVCFPLFYVILYDYVPYIENCISPKYQLCWCYHQTCVYGWSNFMEDVEGIFYQRWFTSRMWCSSSKVLTMIQMVWWTLSTTQCFCNTLVWIWLIQYSNQI